ncbi:HAD-superfamily hydrolase subfamily IIA protein [Dioscorea alata]|uniref:HAD-superfamily hydrolase subfamily IIA protein n=1 Tax=Dioscorea alata TaxID=55571 RepID=A0ACB7UIQ0_DIOAL|nr:HAD-superfamily hydrolase subfamily IIA protein [Dioscorea alata]
MATNGAPSSPSFEALSSRTARSLIDSVDAFLFDCDGVIWTGYKLIDGVPEVLQTLRSLGKKLLFVTNNASKSRKQYVKKFHTLGLDVCEDEIFSSSFAAAMFLKLNNFPLNKKAYVVGAEGILEEMNLAGYACLGGPEGGKNMELDKNLLSECDKSIGAVVVGLDKHINHHKLQYATLCIRENPDCLFIATDAAGHLLANLEQCSDYQCAGCTISSLCASTEKEPIVVGKPSSFIMDILVERFQINPAKTCMVGDRLNTDILFGQNAGCKTLLVLSGVTTLSALQDPSNEIHPNYYTSNVFNIVELLRT